MISHPGRGHTDHDLIVVVAGSDPTVVFCGDLVEESGDPVIDQDFRSRRRGLRRWTGCSMPAGPMRRLFPATARSSTRAYVERQRRWLIEPECDEFRTIGVT